ncbi:anthocyanidin 3-O-glucosyltransferase UFGT [Eucalyptus grandis]|uniref:anthocyanidin 3-O-glucosyltransferase UFGT n=1 Tax=Eucalyptus grandis TaxID=71139 RepID=UPI00192EDDDD|nr:anthocyanidin 3-O-glucosyltransferase UFGT [Eucalyptus grandis]
MSSSPSDSVQCLDPPREMRTSGSGSGSPHVAVLAFPFGTHAAPLLAVIRRLASATPDTLYSFFSTADSIASVFSAYRHLPNLRAYHVGAGVPEGHVRVGKPEEDIELFLRAAPANFRKGMERAVAETGRTVSCLVTDAFFWFAADMAAEMELPWVAFWTAGPASLSAHLYTEHIRQTLGASLGMDGRADETLQFIPGMSKIRIRDLPEGVVFGNLDSLFSRMLCDMGRALPRAAAVFLNSFEELDPTITADLKSKLNNFLNVGPFNLTATQPGAPDESECMSWLDGQGRASVAYVSFGSVTVPPREEIVELAEALEASRVPFIWSLKDHLRENLPEGFLERNETRGMMVAWAPQEEILKHAAIGAFITHCGWNSLLESIGGGGVAMMCRPFFGDQRLNGRMMEEVWGLGVGVEGGVFTKQALLSCLQLLLSQERGEIMRDNMRALRRQAEKAVGPDGSSTRNFELLLDIVSNA